MASPSASQYGSGTVEDLKSKAKQTYDEASDRAQEIAGQASRQAGEVASTVKSAIDRSVKDQPVTTLLMAAAVGFVVGALWKS
ncbi:hypothetical protein [Hyphomicrobium sp.]|uniref:DUF883 family protein n=1 Tax=Hyphomicrobium sp. TaxID=82 RepID=UPI000FACADAA|nr:hypothetical protein [Hyphomicrobium sp.]RUO99016.1 MAG: DUF883 family protein [Hyphomicrobium sp.]